MNDRDIYELFTKALTVTNESLRENRGSGVYGALLSAWDKYLDGHRAGVAVYGDDPDQPFDYFTIRYMHGRFELQSRGKSEHDTEWKVSRDYLRSVADNPQTYIEHPSRLDIDWLKERLPDAAASMLKKVAS